MLQGSMRTHRLLAGAVLLTGMALPGGSALAASITDSYFVGVGDSYTGPYAPRMSRNLHRSWLEQLDAHNSGGSFTNLGVSGTTTATVQASGDSHEQLPAAQTAIGSSGAGIVFIGLGVNDFSAVLQSGAVMTQGEADAVADAAFSNLSDLVNALTTQNPDVQFVIANSVDRGSWAGRSGAAYDHNRAVNTAATQRYNQLIADNFANTSGFAVVDSFSLMEDMLAGDPADSNVGTPGQLFIAGQEIVIDPALSLADDQPADHFWADDAHAGSVFQGLFANVVLTALELELGIDAGAEGLLSIDDIFTTANGAGGATLVASDTGYTFDYGAYVVPEPGSVVALLVGAGLMVGRRRRA